MTKKPHNEFEGSVKATLGRYDQRDLRAMLNVPLLGADSAIGELNMRVSAATLNRDGIQKNRYVNARQSELGTRDREVAMVHLQWRPVDTVSVVYSYDRTRIDERPESVWLTGSNPNRPLGPVVAPYVQQESTRPSGGYYDGLFRAITDVDGHALTVAWDITDNMTFHSLTGYREMSNYGEQDTDGTPLTLLDTRDVQENESISQEFRLVGTALDSRLDYSAGVFYMDEKGDVFNETRTPAGPGVNFAKYRNEALAVYGQLTYAFTDRFNATFGVRYTEEDREMEKAIVNGFYFVDPPFLSDIRTLNPGAVYPKASRSYNNVSPMASVSYNWTEDLMTYFKVSSGYQSGGFNARDATVTDFQNGFDEETIIAYELGMKSTWDSRYQVNAALWFSDYDDKRVNQFNPATLASIQRNAGAVEIWGVELELLAQLTDHLQAGLNYGHVDHKFETYDTVDPATGATIDLSDRSNFPYSARNSASAHLSYEVPMDWALFRARIDWSYRDNMTFLVPKPERNSSGPLHLWNARISFDEISGPGDTSMRVSLWGKNLTNEGYWNFGVNLYETFGFDFNTYGEPRTFGVDLELSF